MTDPAVMVWLRRPPRSRSRPARRSWLPFLARLRRLRPSIRLLRLVFLRRRRPGAACRPGLISGIPATAPASRRPPLVMVGLPRLPRRLQHPVRLLVPVDFSDLVNFSDDAIYAGLADLPVSHLVQINTLVSQFYAIST